MLKEFVIVVVEEKVVNIVELSISLYCRRKGCHCFQDFPLR